MRANCRRREITCFILVCIALLSPVPMLKPVSGVTTFSPGALKGEWIYYGQISTSFQSNIPGVTSNPFITSFAHVTSINSTVTDVTQTNITLTQLWTFDNGTAPRTIVIGGNVATGTGNYTIFGYTAWFIPGGLSAGDSVGLGNSPTINDTIVASYAQSFWPVNVANLTFNTGGVQQIIPFLWERNTGLLMEHTYLVSYINYGYYEDGTLELKATRTNIAAETPDFIVASSNDSVTTMVNTTASTTLTLSTPDYLTISLSFSVSPTGLICTLSARTVNVKTSTNSTLECKGPSGTYQVTVSATSGAKSHTDSLTYQVNSAAAPTILGLTPIIFYTIVAALAAIAALTTAILLWRRKSRVQQTLPTTPQPSETPTPPPSPLPGPPN